MAKHRPIPAPHAPSETSPIDGASPALPLQTNSPDPAPTTKPKHTHSSSTRKGEDKTLPKRKRRKKSKAKDTRKRLPKPPDVDVMTFDPHALPPKVGKRGADGKTYKLTIRQERFCQELIRSDSKSAAYRKAYNCATAQPRTINQCASKLLSNPNVQCRVEQLKAEVMRKTTLSRAWVLEHLMEHATVCLGKKRVKISKASKDGDVHEVEITALDQSAANRALELLGKEAGMFVDRREVGGPGDFARMGDEELMRFIREQQQEIESRTIDLVPESTKVA